MTVSRKILLPVVVAIAAALTATLVFKNPPQSKRGSGQKVAAMSVEIFKVAAVRYPVKINSYGTVRPRTQSLLVAQVGGQIRTISRNFREGGFFEQGDLLLQIDDRDYQAEVKVARAILLSAKQALLEEQARSRQALEDWHRLGDGEKAGPLVLREPQLESARASVLSAEAQLEKARLALERTRIIAPFAGRILTKNVDVGQVVNSNATLARIFAVDYVEVRLPINNSDLGLIHLPEEFRGGDQLIKGAHVDFSSDLLVGQTWQGSVVRTESAIDDLSQQLYVVAQIDNPYDRAMISGSTGKVVPPIKMGQYVTAQIDGKVLDAALVIPTRAIYQGSYVYIVDDGVLQRQSISIRWKNSQDAIVASGLEEGSQLVITPLGQVSSGTPVSITRVLGPEDLLSGAGI